MPDIFLVVNDVLQNCGLSEIATELVTANILYILMQVFVFKTMLIWSDGLIALDRIDEQQSQSLHAYKNNDFNIILFKICKKKKQKYCKKYELTILISGQQVICKKFRQLQLLTLKFFL